MYKICIVSNPITGEAIAIFNVSIRRIWKTICLCAPRREWRILLQARANTAEEAKKTIDTFSDWGK